MNVKGLSTTCSRLAALLVAMLLTACGSSKDTAEIWVGDNSKHQFSVEQAEVQRGEDGRAARFSMISVRIDDGEQGNVVLLLFVAPGENRIAGEYQIGYPDESGITRAGPRLASLRVQVPHQEQDFETHFATSGSVTVREEPRVLHIQASTSAVDHNSEPLPLRVVLRLPSSLSDLSDRSEGKRDRGQIRHRFGKIAALSDEKDGGYGPISAFPQ